VSGTDIGDFFVYININCGGDLVLMDRKERIILLILVGLALVTVYGYGSALISFIFSSEQLPLHIASASILDEDGEMQNVFERGGVAVVQVSLSTRVKDVTDYVLSIRILHEGVVVYQEYVSDSIEFGDVSLHSINYIIPEDAKSGTHILYIYLWSNFLPTGYVIADNSGYSVTFNVV